MAATTVDTPRKGEDRADIQALRAIAVGAVMVLGVMHWCWGIGFITSPRALSR